jgi:hypothetical protein
VIQHPTLSPCLSPPQQILNTTRDKATTLATSMMLPWLVALLLQLAAAWEVYSEQRRQQLLCGCTEAPGAADG